MQVASNTTPDKQAGLERQVQSKERQTAINTKAPAIKSEEKATAAKGAERNETSQYLKVLSRIENLLIQDKLPEAAVEGFVGAIKKQIDLINEADRQMLLKLPEVTKLDLKNLDDLPEMIKNNLRNESKLPALLKVLRQPKFAVLMRTDGKPAPKTYTAQSTQLPTPAKSPAPKLTVGPPNKEKPVLAASTQAVQNIIGKKSTPATNPAA